MLINVGHPERSDRLEQVLSATLARGLRHRPARPVESDEHRPARDGRHGLRGDACARPPARCRATCGPSRAAPAARLAPRLRGGRVYTDDVAPVEWLVDTSIVQVAADGE